MDLARTTDGAGGDAHLCSCWYVCHLGSFQAMTVTRPVRPARKRRTPRTMLTIAQSRVKLSDQRPILMRRPGTASSSAPSTRSEEHTSELQSLMRISYAVF